MTLPESDGDSVVPHAVEATNESGVMKILFPILESFLPAGLRLGDSQNCKWLPQAPNSDHNMDLKPDGFVICATFLQAYKTSTGQRPSLGTMLFSCLRCLVEGKHNDSHGTAATGQAAMYAAKLINHLSCLLVLLIDKCKFRAECWDRGVLVGYVDGNLTSGGSKAFLAKFLLGAGNDKNQFLLPRTSRVDCLEDIVQSSMRFLSGYRLVPTLPVLGIGGTAIVLHMTNADGDSVAVKVVKPDRAAFFLRERGMYDSVQGLQVVKLIESHGEGENPSFFVLTPVGEALTTEAGIVTSGVLALAELHRSGFAHGDARRANFIKVGSKAVLIDFSHSFKLSDDVEIAKSVRCDDIARFLASINRIPGSSDLERSWKSLVPESLARKVSDFVNGQTPFDEAQELVRSAKAVEW